MLSLGPLALTAPWMLAALAALPLIWWLLRVTPPMPRRIPFPPVRILRGLRQEEETPASTPWWLTVLRLLLAVLAVLALAHPLWQPGGALPGEGPVLLVVDDGWAAAPSWKLRQRAAMAVLDRAERQDRAVIVLGTAAPASGENLQPSGLLDVARARSLVRARQPKPWPVDRATAAAVVNDLRLDERPGIVWLSDGIDDGAAGPLAEALVARGPVQLLQPAGPDRAMAMLPPAMIRSGFEVTVLRADRQSPATAEARAIGERGRILGRGLARFEAGSGQAKATLELPGDSRNRVLRLELAGAPSAGGLALLDERWRRRPVGLVSGGAVEGRSQPLLSNLYYLDRAMAPYAELRKGLIDGLLEQPLAVMVLADIGRLPKAQHQRLTQWVDDGGMLIRFAGPHLAQGADPLIPVTLRQGGRALGGALSWSVPARLAAFPEHGPFHGLTVPDEVVVSRQVLAQPSLDLADRTWARLADGTPLVTGARRGQGWLVLFHSTANTDWSNLPLSGLFVDMLRRLTAMSRGVAGKAGGQLLPPLATLDGFGRLGDPGPAARPIAADAIDQAAPGPRTPPGYYGSEAARRALNLTRGWRELRPIGTLPVPVAAADYRQPGEVDLKPWLLGLALLLALADLAAVLSLRGLLRPTVGAAGLALLTVLTALPEAARGQSQGSDEFAMAATLDTRLAYVLTGDGEIDAMSRAGLFGLSDVLQRRTSVEPAEPLAVNVERDELVFFPLLYWPISASQPALTDQALARLSNYLRTGGTIVFDSRDAGRATPALARRLGAAGGAGDRLRRLLSRLDIPPLVPVPHNHVLTKAFYLMQTFPGRYADGRVWVELRPGGVNDGVSSLIVGSNDWASAWAMDADRRPIAAVIPGGERQREMAFRFGVNLVMYVLTGNYKSDQVHVPAILERLGQ